MPGLEEAFDRVGAILEHRLPLMHAPGAAIAMTDRTELLGVVVRGFADAASGTPVRPETRFQIGSISKSFAAIVALQEVEAGRLDLHVPVTEVVPWVELPQPFGSITLHHLLSHTSGLATGTEAVLSGPGAVWNLRHLAPGFPPGKRFWYSNDGYKLVGVVLEHVTGMPIHELLNERLLHPLGMAHSTAAITNNVRTDQATGYATLFDDRPPHIAHPLVEARWIVCNTADGSIVSDAIDMAAYARLLLNRGAGVLSPESYDRLTTPVIESDVGGYRYAYGLDVSLDRQEIRHSGGMLGFTALMACRLDRGLACVMLVNGGGDRRATVEFALQTVEAGLVGDPLPEVTYPPDAASTPDASSFAGTYRGDGRELTLVARGDRLVLHEDDVEVILERAEGDAFLVPHPELGRFQLSFARDAEGHVFEAFHGGDWLPGDSYDGPGPPTAPVRWRAFEGHYRGPGLWEPSFRIVIRKGMLLKIAPNEETEESELELVPLADGSFRVGAEEWRPERIRFEDEAAGKTLRAVLDGASWHRTFEP